MIITNAQHEVNHFSHFSVIILVIYPMWYGMLSLCTPYDIILTLLFLQFPIISKYTSDSIRIHRCSHGTSISIPRQTILFFLFFPEYTIGITAMYTMFTSTLRLFCHIIRQQNNTLCRSEHSLLPDNRRRMQAL